MPHVLLVDDDSGQLRIREMILRSSGINVHGASDVNRALDILRSQGNEIGLVVTDHYLDGNTGADFVRELRRIAPSMPVLVLSGAPDIEQNYDGLDVSVRQKPFPPQQFIQDVQKLLSK